MKKRALFVILGAVLGAWGCSFSAGTIQTPTQSPEDQVGTIVAATMQAYTPSPVESTSTQVVTSPAATQGAGAPISFEGVSFVVYDGLASSATPEKMTAVESNSGGPWGIAPTHLRFTLTGYALQGKFHEPRLFVYPAGEYAASNAYAAEQIDNLKKILAGAAMLEETLPRIPFFNAGPLMAASMQIVPFQNGSGIRALTEYAQYSAPVNNRELFYHFQGLTNDGKYYLIAILPVTAPILAEDEKPDAAVPEGGVPIPSDVGPNQVYYFSITEKLNMLAPDAFLPSLEVLDALIRSILVT